MLQVDHVAEDYNERDVRGLAFHTSTVLVMTIYTVMSGSFILWNGEARG